MKDVYFTGKLSEDTKDLFVISYMSKFCPRNGERVLIEGIYFKIIDVCHKLVPINTEELQYKYDYVEVCDIEC